MQSGSVVQENIRPNLHLNQNSEPAAGQSRHRRPLRSRFGLAAAALVCLATLMTGEAEAQAVAQPVAHFPVLAAGATATATMSVTVTATATGSIASVQVLTQGSPNSEFVNAGSGSCVQGGTILATQSCTVDVILQPKYPGGHRGALVLRQSSGEALGVTYMDGLSYGSIGVIVPGIINGVAGDGTFHLLQDDGVAATSASIFLPMGMAVDGAGNLFFSDSNNNRIRRVDKVTGLISTLAGNGNPGFSGDNGLATAALISGPSALVLDGAGNLYFADTGNDVVRRISATTGVITSVAGIGTQHGYSGNPSQGTVALLNQPYGLALDTAQNLYIADTSNNVIRELALSSGVITTVAGTIGAGYVDGPATAAKFSTPWGLSITPDGTLYIADQNNNVIRKVTPAGIVSTVVGSGTRGFSGDGGPGSSASLNSPAAVAVDVAGNIYVADSGNNRIRKLNAQSQIIGTIVGSTGSSDEGDNGNSDKASLYGPYAIVLDSPGDLYIADMLHNRVRKVSNNIATLSYDTLRVDRVSPQQSELFENDGNADLALTALTLNNAALDAGKTTCFAPSTMTTGTSCTIGAEFAPTTISNPVTSPVSGTITLASNAGNSTGVINVSGIVLDVDPTSVSLISSANPAAYGTPITLTSQVKTSGTTVTGTIEFMDGTTSLGKVTIVSGGAAALTIPSMTRGSHSLTAVYSGDASNAASTSTPALIQVIKQATTLGLASSLNPSVVTANVTFTATLSGFLGTPVGTVTFTDGGANLTIVNLSAAGTATYSTTSLVPGPHSILGTYSGDGANMDGPSNVVTQTVNKADTTTLITTTNSSITVGSAVTFTASVASNGGPAPSGAVTFKDGAVSIGSGNLVSGVATLTTSALAPAEAATPHSITAVYVGDGSNATSTSPILSETVLQIGTGTTLATSANPSNAGAALTLTATVAATGGSTAGGALTGSVTFYDGAATIGTGTLSGGVATKSVSALSVGAHTLTAVYSGNTNYATSTSSGFAQQIQNSTTTTTLGSSLNAAVAGKNVVLTATVVTVGGAATGTVTFTDGAVTIGQGTLAANGVTSMSVSTLAVGTHNIIATYNGDSNNTKSSSTSLSQVVQIATTNLSLTATPNPTIAGVNVRATATLTWNGGQPTGVITFQDGGTVVGSVAINGTVPVSISLPSLSVGTHPLTASYVGDANNSAVTSAVVSEVIAQAGTTTDIATSQNPIALGQSVTFSSNVKSASSLIATGTVTFHDGAGILGTVTLNAAGSVTLQVPALTLGSHSITAVYSGDVNHSASSSATTITQQVLQATVATLTSSGNPAIAGKVVTFTTRLTGINGVVPTGTIAFKDGGAVLGVITVDASGAASFSTSTLVLGAHSIVASYSGDTNFNAVNSAALTQTIQIADTNIALTSSSNPAVSGTVVAFTASLTGTGGPVTGTVAILDGTAVIGRATLNGSGVAVFSTSTLSPGMHSISAAYSGDSNNSPNSSGVLQQQVQQTTRTSLSSSANPSLTLNSVTITAAVANGGPQPATGTITFTEGSSLLGSVVLDGNGLATIVLPSLTAGSHPIVATYSGDVANLPSVSIALAQVVQLRATTTVLTATSTSLSGGQQITLISVVSFTGPIPPTGTVSFKNGTTVLGTSPVDKTGVATLTVILNATQVNLVASYSGDLVYSPSASSSTPITTGPATQFTLDLSSAVMSLQSKQHSTVDLTLTSIKGFSDTMTLGCLGLPYAATCTFSAAQPLLAGNTVQTVHLVIDTGSPLGAGTSVTAKNQSSSLSSTTMLAFMPLGGLIGILIFRSRRRISLGGLLFVLCFFGLSLGLSGCGTLQINGTPAGTYSFKITAVGLNSGVSQSKDMTLTVTQ
jgi:sugar lactone lactonase YvrE